MVFGGDFLAREANPAEILTPEELDAESRMMARAAADFMRGEVLPAANRIEAREPGLMESLLARAANLGLLGPDIPEDFGGLGLKQPVSALITEMLAAEPSFSVSHSVHTSVATLPILFFGTPEQKAKYLPQLASGQRIGAYALSEAHAGSDAMAARTRAVRQPDGSYMLTGEKMWITNASFAGLFIVFAQTAEGLSAFIVERETPGLSIGREEHKLGLKGSSTARVLLQDARVPGENLLGAPGDGGRIALYTLNLGRFKIAAAAVGQCKHILQMAARYSKQRVAFGKPICEHGLIQEKLALMAARTFAAESMLYRLAGYLDSTLEKDEGGRMKDESDSSPIHPSEEFAIECAIVKVYATEALSYVADESLQILGGYGYTEEFPIARAWRDARVTRIYEGTSEINRLNIAGMVWSRWQKGRIKLDDPVWRAIVERFPDLTDHQQIAGALANRFIGDFASRCITARSALGSKTQDDYETRIAAAGLVAMVLDESFSFCRIILMQACGDKAAQIFHANSDSVDQAELDPIGSCHIVASAVIEAEGYPW